VRERQQQGLIWKSLLLVTGRLARHGSLGLMGQIEPTGSGSVHGLAAGEEVEASRAKAVTYPYGTVPITPGLAVSV
jgi:hypothetical protein